MEALGGSPMTRFSAAIGRVQGQNGMSLTPPCISPTLPLRLSPPQPHVSPAMRLITAPRTVLSHLWHLPQRSATFSSHERRPEASRAGGKSAKGLSSQPQEESACHGTKAVAFSQAHVPSSMSVQSAGQPMLRETALRHHQIPPSVKPGCFSSQTCQRLINHSSYGGSI